MRVESGRDAVRANRGRGFVKQVGRPAVFLRRDFDVAQHAADVNRLAVIAAVIMPSFCTRRIRAKLRRRKEDFDAN